MKLVLRDTVYQIGLWYNICVRWAMTPHPPLARSPCLACGLGHTRDLTAIQAVIQHPRAASLPTGEGIRLPATNEGIPMLRIALRVRLHCDPLRMRRVERREQAPALRYDSILISPLTCYAGGLPKGEPHVEKGTCETVFSQVPV